MDLYIHWYKPLKLRDGSEEDLIFTIDNLDKYDNLPGVYIFCRKYAEELSPLYIGKSLNVASRIRSHLNSTKLMKKLQKAKNGDKILIIGEFVPKGKQSTENWISFIEKALIKQAIENGHKLINTHGTKTKTHKIKFSGHEGGKRISGRTICC